MTREEAISRQAVLDLLENTNNGWIINKVLQLPPVNPQKPICPSAGVDCEDCPAYEDTISRKAVLNTLENMDSALDEDRTVESYKELLRECYKVLPSVTPKPKSECEHDHEILKAYSDGANAVLDNIRAEIAKLWKNEPCAIEHGCLNEILQIIDKYIAEEDKA